MSGGIYEGPGGEMLHGDGKPVGEGARPLDAEHQHWCELGVKCKGLHACLCGHEWQGDPWPQVRAQAAQSPRSAPPPSKDGRCPNCDCDEIRQVEIMGEPYWKCVMCGDDWPFDHYAASSPPDSPENASDLAAQARQLLAEVGAFAREIDDVRAGYRKLKADVLAALGITDPWAITTWTPKKICDAIEQLRASEAQHAKESIEEASADTASQYPVFRDPPTLQSSQVLVENLFHPDADDVDFMKLIARVQSLHATVEALLKRERVVTEERETYRRAWNDADARLAKTLNDRNDINARLTAALREPSEEEARQAFHVFAPIVGGAPPWGIDGGTTRCLEAFHAVLTAFLQKRREANE